MVYVEFIMGVVFGIAISAVLPQLPQAVRKMFEKLQKKPKLNDFSTDQVEQKPSYT